MADGDIIIEEGVSGGGEEGGGSDDAEIIDSEGSGSEGDISEGDGGEEGDRGGDEEPESRGAGRPTNAGELRKALRELAQNEDFAKRFPRLEKDLTAALFSRQQIAQMGGLRAISAAMEKVETRGGLEKLEEDYQELEESRLFNQGLERGDPKVVEGWAKDFPDGFKRAVLPMFEQLGKLDEVKAEQVASSIMAQYFDKMGVFDTISELGRVLAGMKDDVPGKADAVKMFNGLARFANSAKTLGEKAKQDPYAARSEELDRREQSITQKDREAFHSAVRSEVGTQVTRKMNDLLTDKLRSMKVFHVPSRTANRLRQNISSEVKRRLSADPNYAREYNRIAATGDRARAIQFIVRSSERHLAKAIAETLPDFNLKPSGKPGGQRRFASSSRGGGDRSGGEGNFVSGRPKTNEVDFTRTDKAVWVGHVSSGFKNPGQAYLKNGKIAKWG